MHRLVKAFVFFLLVSLSFKKMSARRSPSPHAVTLLLHCDSFQIMSEWHFFYLMYKCYFQVGTKFSITPELRLWKDDHNHNQLTIKHTLHRSLLILAVPLNRPKVAIFEVAVSSVSSVLTSRDTALTNRSPHFHPPFCPSPSPSARLTSSIGYMADHKPPFGITGCL